MTLEEINKRLIEVMTELTASADTLAGAQYDYDRRKAELYLMADTQAQKRAEERDSYVSQALEAEDLTYSLMKKKSVFKRLLNEKEFLFEIGNNIRVIEIGKRSQHG